MNKDKPNYLPDSVNWHYADNAKSLANTLSQNIVKLLSTAISNHHRASLAVSGGTTPIAFFKALSTTKLNWEKIDITLVDERWVDANHQASNELLVRQQLLKNNALSASFTPLKTNAKDINTGRQICENNLTTLAQPFDIVVLGMGNDGHTASLFPCSAELNSGMAHDNQDNYIVTNPSNAPYQRISLTRTAISKAKHIVLHIVGVDKLKTIEKAMKNQTTNKMPIYTFLNQPLELYWSP